MDRVSFLFELFKYASNRFLKVGSALFDFPPLPRSMGFRALFFMNTNKDIQAQKNLKALSENPYPGRGIALGLHENGRFAVQVYWIMGRSENSRNRVFESENGRLFTVAADPSKVKDPSLIIYNAMNEANGRYIVSNGDQTDDVYKGARVGDEFEWSLHDRIYEPDAPNFTSRITGEIALDPKPSAKFAILRRSPWDDSCERHMHYYPVLVEGFGYCVTTYQGDGDPLPPFQGEPILVNIWGSSAEEIAFAYWDMLDSNNRVSIAVKMIDIKSGESQIRVINRFSKVS